MFSNVRSEYSSAPYHRMPDDKAVPSGSKVKSLPAQSAQTGSAKTTSPKPESKSHGTPDRVLRAQALPVSPAVARMVRKDLAAIIVAVREKLGAHAAKTAGSRPEPTRTVVKIDFTPWREQVDEPGNLAFMLEQLAASRAAIVSTPPHANALSLYHELLGLFLTDVIDVASSEFKVKHLKLLLKAFPSAALLKTPSAQLGFAHDFSTALLTKFSRPGQTTLVEWIISEVMRTDHDASPDLLAWRHMGLFNTAMRAPTTRLLLWDQLVQALEDGRNMPASSWVALGNEVGRNMWQDARTRASTTAFVDDVFKHLAAADQTLTSAAWFLSGLIRHVCQITQDAGPDDRKLALESYRHLQTVLGGYLLKHPTLAAVTARDPGATAFDERVLDKIGTVAKKLLYPDRAPSLNQAPGFGAAPSEQRTDEPLVAAISEQQTDAPFVAAISVATKTGPTASSSSQDLPAPGPGAY